MAAAPETDMSDLGALIARDPMLSANVLRVANSAAYTSAKAVITTIPDAIRQIGCGAVGRIAAAVAVIDCIPDVAAHGFNPIRAWQHAFAVAQLCRQLSPNTDTTGGVAYLVGLCHDLTDILFHTHFPAEAGYITQTVRATAQPRAQVERNVLGMTHSQLVPIVLGQIGLPPTIRQPIVDFHNAVSSGNQPGEVLACRLWMAELYANGLLLAASPDSLVAPLTPTHCKRAGVEAQPLRPNAAALRGEVFTMTAMMARLSPKQDVALAEPLLPRGAARIWLTQSSDSRSSLPSQARTSARRRRFP